MELVFSGGFCNGEHRNPSIADYKVPDAEYFSDELNTQKKEMYSEIAFFIENGEVCFRSTRHFQKEFGRYTDYIFYEKGALDIRFSHDSFEILELSKILNKKLLQNKHFMYRIRLSQGQIYLSEKAFELLKQFIYDENKNICNSSKKLFQFDKTDFIELKFSGNTDLGEDVYRATFESSRVNNCKEYHSYDSLLTLKIFKESEMPRIVFVSERIFKWPNYPREYSSHGRSFFETGEIPLIKRNMYEIPGLKRISHGTSGYFYCWEIEVPFGKFYFSHLAIQKLILEMNG